MKKLCFAGVPVMAIVG